MFRVLEQKNRCAQSRAGSIYIVTATRVDDKLILHLPIDVLHMTAPGEMQKSRYRAFNNKIQGEHFYAFRTEITQVR